MSFQIDWFDKEVLAKTKMIVDAVSKEVAGDVVEDAKKILKQKAKKTSERGLLTQFSVDKSRFKDGGYLAQCQGPKNWREPYHASFVEMGTFKDEAKPFMRPAARKNKRIANKKYQDALDKL